MDEIPPSENSKNPSLARALEYFSLETKRLETAYNSLKEEFTMIHDELQKANRNLDGKVKELGAMTFYLESILSNISQGIVFVNLNGDVTTFNKSAQKILHAKDSEVVDFPFWLHFPDDVFGFSMRKALADREAPASASAVIETPQQVNCYLEINAAFVNEESKVEVDEIEEFPVKKLEGVLVIFRDVTDLRSLQLIAGRNDRMKELGEMAAIVAHEIRNPIGGIKGFASLLRRDLKEGSRQEQIVNNIIAGCDDLNHFVTNVLNYSRPIVPKFEHYDIVKILKDLKEHFEADIGRKNEKIEVQIKTDIDQLLLYIDPKIMNSALMNMMVNACEAMPNGGKITLSLEIVKSLAVIRVADEGCGIPEENLEKIFTPFFTTKPEGNGFGLAEVHKDIQAHRGVVEVESAVGKGSTFIITLPLVEGTTLEEKKRAPVQ